MAKKFSTPGITVIETDISEVVAPVGTSVGVGVGGAKRGLANSRRLITTDKDFIEEFGQPTVPGSSSKDFGIYGALAYLQESDTLYYTRVVNADDDYANKIFPMDTELSGTSAVSATTINAVATSAYTANSYVADERDEIRAIDTMNGTPVGVATSGSLIIASVGPGTYGNNVGVTVTTSASYSNSASTNQVEWAWDYDEPESNGDPSSATDAIWKKVFKINVYSRTDSGSAFGDVLETWYGTIGDNLAPDGSQLNIEDIVNGNSKYIYVNDSGLTAGVPNESPDETASGIKTAMALENGDDSALEVDNSNVTAGLDFYSDREKITYNIIQGTYVDDTVDAKIMAIIAGRKDAIGTVQVGGVTEFDVSDLVDLSNSQSFSDPSYLAKYVGWSLIYDSFNDKKIFVPNSIYGASIMAKTDNVANVWNAPAGINRGILPVLGQNVKFNDTQIGLLYDANLNTVKFIKGYGNVLWGQRTAQRKVSALREIAVRRALLFIEGTVEPSLLPFIFEPNVDSVRLRIFSIIDGFLSTVKAGGGVDNYKVVVDDTNNSAQDRDNNVLNVDLYIQPARTIEFIQLQVIITRSGVSLAEVTV